MVAVIGIASVVTAATFLAAWVCEDAFITFRYVANVLAGHLAVFNLGDQSAVSESNSKVFRAWAGCRRR